MMKLKMKGKISRERPILYDGYGNIDSHLKGKNTSLNEIDQLAVVLDMIIESLLGV